MCVDSLLDSYLSVLSDVQSIQKLLKYTLKTIASADGYRISLANLKESYVDDKIELKKLLA